MKKQEKKKPVFDNEAIAIENDLRIAMKMQQ
jgi:hypothetical protein